MYASGRSRPDYRLTGARACSPPDGRRGHPSDGRAGGVTTESKRARAARDHGLRPQHLLKPLLDRVPDVLPIPQPVLHERDPVTGEDAPGSATQS